MKQRNTIRVERAIMHITQAELAERIGVTPQCIHSIEVGKVDPKVRTAMRISRYFGKKVSEVFTVI